MRVILGLLVCAFIFSVGTDFAFASTKQFFIDEGRDPQGRDSLKAERLFLSRHAQILVDSSYWARLGEEEEASARVAIAELVAEFDTRIHPLTRELLGSEWNPGIDRDTRVVLLFIPMQEGSYGYTRPFLDETRAEGSNEAEIIYINATALGSARTKASLASSFAQLIAYHERIILANVEEEPWVLAMAGAYAPTYLGYDTPFTGSQLASDVEVFLDAPNNSFTDWDGRERDQASISLFTHFLAGRHGTSFFSYLMRSSQQGERGVTLALRATGSPETFASTLSAWALANSVNGTTTEGGLYAYAQPSLGFSRVRVTPEYRAPIGEGSASVSRFLLGPWSAQWVRYTPRILGSQELNSLFLNVEGFHGTDTTISYIETAINGTSRVKTMRVRGGVGTARVDLFGTYVLSVVLVPTNTSALRATVEVEAYQRESDRANAEGLLSDGALVREEGSDKVFVIQGESRRWIQSPEIFSMYGHMRWEDIHLVPGSTLAWYRESFLVRAKGQREVYEVTTRGAKRWLNMSAGAFRQSGRRWADVFVINEKELLWYADAQER